MGAFNKMRRYWGDPPRELLENGLLGRGTIMSVKTTQLRTRNETHTVCVFTVEVALDNEPLYQVTFRMGMKSPRGVDIYVLALTIVGEDGNPTPVQVGMEVPPDCLPLLCAGADLPAKRLGAPADGQVLIDWNAAVAQAAPAAS